MARGPDGGVLPPDEPGSAGGLSSEDLSFARGLEAIIDRALQRSPPGDAFVYGIHQGISGEAAEYLRARYSAAGWGEVSLKPGATGALLLSLYP